MANASSNESQQWPDLAIGLYDKLTGRNAEITYEFHDVVVQVPDRAGKGAVHAPWRIDGSLTIHTRDRSEA